MKEIVKLRYLAALVLLGACLLIGITLKFADEIDGDNSLPAAYHQKKAMDKQKKLDEYRASHSLEPNVNNFPRNWGQMEKGHPVETYIPKGIPKYNSIWRGIDSTRTLVSNHYEFWVNGERVVYLVLDDPNQLYLHLSLFDSTTLKQ